MAYKAGDLEVEILGINNDAILSIQNTAKALSALSRSIEKLNTLSTVFVGNKLSNIFQGIADATKSIDTTNIIALGNAGKSLSALTRLNKLGEIDYNTVAKGFENLTVAITPFLEKVQSAEASLTALYGTLNKASGKKLQNLLNGETTSKPSKGSSNLFNLAKWGSLIYLGRRFGRIIANIAQAGADYTETLNLWETSMGSNLNMATEFVNKMNEAYGISEKTLMNAQAIFKNMLGSLGQISDTMAYSLSEGITQMALDYASLYNVTFEKAFEKFQAALAGQVRPIRSVAGYDITETTLYQLYQELGGTKSMRQLNRTEKQLLSIYAVFQQMERSGAVGDLKKTMESFANQSRVMAESWQQVKTYAGSLITYTLQESGIMTYINALLIFIGDTLKAVAESMGAIQHFGGDLFEPTTDSAKEAGDAIDEVQGKLLDFDKFRSLSGAEENALGLDETLLEALSGFDSILENASMEARNLAENLKLASGLFNEDGSFNLEKWEELEKKIKTVGIALGSLFGGFLLASIIKFFVSPLGLATLAISSLIFGITELVSAWDKMTSLEKVITILSGITAGLLGVVIGIKSLKLSIPAALALGGMLAGGILAIQSSLAVDKFANGGMPDKGTMFIAGEAGAEMVYNTPSGQSGVANIQQIEQAMYGALVRYGKTQGANGQAIEVYLDGEKVYQNTTAHAKRRGNVWGRA